MGVDSSFPVDRGKSVVSRGSKCLYPTHTHTPQPHSRAVFPSLGYLIPLKFHLFAVLDLMALTYGVMELVFPSLSENNGRQDNRAKLFQRCLESIFPFTFN